MNEENNALTQLLTGAIQAMATRPQKTSTITDATTSSMPYAYDNMVANRDRIGQATRDLDEALKLKETTAYALTNALAAIPQQQGYGSWLTDFARSLGGGLSGSMNAYMSRAAQKYDNEMKDLETILKYDKEMGNVQNAVTRQLMGYTPMEYAGGKTATGGTGGGQSLGSVPVNNFGRSVGYDPAANVPDFGMFSRTALDDSQISTPFKYIGGGQSISKGITNPETRQWLQTTWQDISDNILKGSTLDFIGSAGSVRIADTEEEKRALLGELYNYKNKSPEELQQLLIQARNNFVTTGLRKAREQGVPVTSDELVNYWNSAFTVPQYLQSAKMYNTADAGKFTGEKQKTDEDPWAAYRVPATK